MAKKSKKQKAGMLKRKQQKKTKKALQRRQVSSRLPQQPNSEKELQKLLQRIPILAYEPELDSMRFDQGALATELDAETTDPVIIMKLLNPDFLAEFEKQMKIMEERVETDMQKNLMVKGMLYALEHDEMPHFVNPLIVAIYLRTKADLASETLSPGQILKAVEQYEVDHMELIESLIEATKEQEAAAAEVESSEPQLPEVEGEEVEGELVAPEAKVLQLDEETTDVFFDSLDALEDEARERVIEDVETFLEDYVSVPPEQWSTEVLDDFLGNWFVENLNPVVDDLISMQQSLEKLFHYLGAQGKIPAEVLEPAIALLQDHETYKQRMTA